MVQCLSAVFQTAYADLGPHSDLCGVSCLRQTAKIPLWSQPRWIECPEPKESALKEGNPTEVDIHKPY